MHYKFYIIYILFIARTKQTIIIRFEKILL